MSDREAARKWVREERRRIRAEGRTPATANEETLARIVRILWPKPAQNGRRES